MFSCHLSKAFCCPRDVKIQKFTFMAKWILSRTQVRDDETSHNMTEIQTICPIKSNFVAISWNASHEMINQTWCFYDSWCKTLCDISTIFDWWMNLILYTNIFFFVLLNCVKNMSKQHRHRSSDWHNLIKPTKKKTRSTFDLFPSVCLVMEPKS